MCGYEVLASSFLRRLIEREEALFTTPKIKPPQKALVFPSSQHSVHVVRVSIAISCS